MKTRKDRLLKIYGPLFIQALPFENDKENTNDRRKGKDKRNIFSCFDPLLFGIVFINVLIIIGILFGVPILVKGCSKDVRNAFSSNLKGYSIIYNNHNHGQNRKRNTINNPTCSVFVTNGIRLWYNK